MRSNLVLGEMGEEKKEVIFRDIRRYYCEFCGICRSKKSLISSHILSNHHDEMERRKDEVNEDVKKKKGPKVNICEECGVSFQKPAHLKQHMQSHSLEIGNLRNFVELCEGVKHWIPKKRTPKCKRQRPFVCHIDDCQSSYRRKDHLMRHLLQHQGKLFECPVDSCKRAFSIQGNMTRHVKEMHDQCASPEANLPKHYVCSEPRCGKVFKFASKLKKHEDSHVKLGTMEALCLEPGCMKHFTNEKCLKEHIESCHQHIVCEICGTKQLKKNIKRHLRSHEEESTSERIKCEFQDCQHTFSTKSNLIQHVKAVHLGDKPFSCGVAGCGMKFAFKHVRDRHEKSGCHVYTPGDFVEADEQFRSRPRGGRKRKLPVFEAIVRKRIKPPCDTDPMFYQGSEYLSWLLSAESDEEL